MAVASIPYTQVPPSSGFKPYLEIVYFYNNSFSPKTFGLMDSGADVNVLPYSVGKSINLPDKTEIEEIEELKQLSGVGGGVSILERKCKVFIFNDGKAHGFEELVWWVYPDQQLIDAQNKLVGEIAMLRKHKSETVVGTDLEKYFELEISGRVQQIISMNNVLEPGILLGRPFFNNFNFVQFCQRDKAEEEKCVFNYEIRKKAIKDTVDLKKTTV